MRSQQMNGGKKPKKTARRRRKNGFGRFIFLIVLIVLLVVGGVTAIRHFSDSSYNDEKSFEKYAKKYFKENQLSSQVGDSIEVFDYGTPVSTASYYPEVGFDSVDELIYTKVDELNTQYVGNNDDEDDTQKFAQLTTYDSYKSKKNTGSVVLKTAQIEEQDNGKFVQKGEVVNTFTYSTDNGAEVYPVMAFESGYKDKLSEYFDEYLQNQYNNELTDNYKDYIDPDNNNNFSKFALTKSGAIFYFDSGTVTNGNEIIAIEVDSDKVEGIFRDEINPKGLDPSKPMVALTYDDGPSATASMEILDVLEEYNAVATFFELGENVENVKNAAEILQREEELGCEIGSHSYNHPNLFTLTDAQIKEQNDKTDAAIEAIVGHAPTVYRPPYGNGNDNTTAIFNKPGILWSVDTLDWKSRNAEAVVNQVKSIENLDGKVVLMHSIYESTAEATKTIVPWLQEQGYQLVTVSELLTYKYGVDPSEVEFYGYNYFYLND